MDADTGKVDGVPKNDTKPTVAAPFTRRFLVGRRSLAVTVPIALIIIAGGVAVLTLPRQVGVDPPESVQRVMQAAQHLRITEARARLGVLKADVLAQRPQAQLLAQFEQIRSLLEPTMAEAAEPRLDWGEVRLALDELRSRLRSEDPGVVEMIDELQLRLKGRFSFR